MPCMRSPSAITPNTHKEGPLTAIMQKITVIAGATASGKSAAALAVAQAFGGEIVSADSMQVYRRMNIGTAKPSEAERRAVVHHMVDVCAPDEAYSLAQYVDGARRAIADILSRGKLPVICGGTGLYIDTVVDGTELSRQSGDEELRPRLAGRAESEGVQTLWNELNAVDPESAAAIHPNNVRRVIRALEIYLSTGVPKSEWDRRSVGAAPLYDVRYFVLTWTPRERLYERINRRVDEMFMSGLEAEARALYDKGVLSPQSVGGQAIGYKELVPYFEGRSTLGEAAEAIKQATRRYAKRQETWFRRRRDAIQVDGEDAARQILADLELWLRPCVGDAVLP